MLVIPLQGRRSLLDEFLVRGPVSKTRRMPPEEQASSVRLWPPHACVHTVTHAHTCTHTHMKHKPTHTLPRAQIATAQSHFSDHK